VVTAPERQCIGCGCRAPQGELIRLTLDRSTAPPRVVVARGKDRSGRGAYLCKRQLCLDRALHRKAFQRAFRTTVVVDENDITVAITRGAPPDDKMGG
jgi:uncharacterized protein